MRWMLCASLLAALTGCHAFYADVDGRVAERADQPIDVQHTSATEARKAPGKKSAPARTGLASLGSPMNDDGITLVGAQEAAQPPEKDKKGSMYDNLTKNTRKIPGGEAPDLDLPKSGAPKEEWDKKLEIYFPALPAMPKLPEAKPGPTGYAMTLADLQQTALRNNPKIRQAHLDIEAARGAALQAGLYPNPTIAYEGSTIGQGQTPGQQGGSVEQTIITMGKLTLARSAALREMQITQQNLKAAEADVQAQVRAGYFTVLSARENYRVMKSLAELTDNLYEVLLVQLRIGQVAGYEPMQIRVLSLQARGALVLAHNRYVSAWQQLAATLGMPTMPLTDLAGKIDMPVPRFEQGRVLAYVLENHSDVIAARLGVEKGRFLVRLAEVQPYPDVTTHVGFQKDYTQAPFGAVANVSVGVPFPLWNRNQGNIQSARAQLERAVQENDRVHNDLTARIAEAFERYENNRALLELYKKNILPNQVQAFRLAVARHVLVPDKSVSYNDLVTAQQTLATLVTTYLGVLNDQWTSVVDISRLLQTRDLFQLNAFDEVAPVPDFDEIIRSGRRHHRR